MDGFILKMKSYVDALSAVGHKIYNDELILFILVGLGSEHEYIIVNITSCLDSLTLQDVQYLLHNHEHHLEKFASHTLDNVQANMVTLSLGCHRNIHGNGRGYRGITHGGRGTFGRSGGRNNKIIYQVCGKPCHSSLKYFHRFDMSIQGKESTSSGVLTSQPQAFITTTTHHLADGAGHW